MSQKERNILQNGESKPREFYIKCTLLKFLSSFHLPYIIKLTQFSYYSTVASFCSIQYLSQKGSLFLCVFIPYEGSHAMQILSAYAFLLLISQFNFLLLLLLLSRFSRVQLCATPQMEAHQASPSLGFSRQEHWSGLPFASPMHESEK